MGREIIIPISCDKMRVIGKILGYSFVFGMTSLPIIFIIAEHYNLAFVWFLMGGWFPLCCLFVIWSQDGKLPHFKCKSEPDLGSVMA